MLGHVTEAKKVYMRVLKHDPHNVRVLVSLGKLLLGIGLNNPAALRACALNTDEALPLLHRADAVLSLQESGQQLKKDSAFVELHSTVQDILQFCKEEHAEVAHWSAVAASIEGAKPGATSSQRSWPHVLHPSGFNAVTEKGQGTRTIRGHIKMILRAWSAYWKRLLRKVLALPTVGKDTSSSPSTARKDVRGRQQQRESLHTYTEFLTLDEKIERTRRHWDKRGFRRVSAKKTHRFLECLAAHDERESKPVVITNFQEHWYSSSGCNSSDGNEGGGSKKSHLLSRKVLTSDHGDRLVRVSVSASDRFDGPEPGDLWGLSAQEEVLVRPPSSSMRLADFFSLTDAMASATYGVDTRAGPENRSKRLRPALETFLYGVPLLTAVFR